MTERDPSPQRRSSAAFWVLLTLVATSLDPIFVKLGYRGSVTPLQLLLLKNVAAALVILPLTRTFRWVGLRGVARIASVSMLLLTTNGCSLFALRHLSAAAVITLVSLTPAAVAMINQVRGRDRLTARFWLGFGMCFAGVLLTADVFGMAPAGGFHLVGFLAALGAVVSSTVYRTRMEDLTHEYTPLLVSSYAFLVNALAAVLFLWPVLPPIPAYSLPLGLWLGLTAACANVAFLTALHLVGSTNISIFNMLSRPMVIVAAWLFLGESLDPLQILGVVLVLTGLPLASVKRKSS
ncbi:MAG: DMT family transporter [Candidatus Eremiobacterota bacterium]